MFTSKSFFSQIICPYQEKCMLPGCIFGHPENQLNGNGSQNGLNLDESQKSGTSRTTLTEPGEILKSPEGEDKPRQRKPSPHEGLSPPPLRRKVLDGTAIPVKHSLSQKGILNLPSSVPTPSSSKPTPKIPTQATPKKESLNPRALKGPAPAKHDLRWKLIQALHEHLKRLNSELAKDANDEVGKLVLSQQQLITMTLDIEEEASYQPSIYSNLVKNKILVYKKMTVGDWKFERHNEVLAKATIAAQSDTPVSESTNPPKPIETGLSLSEELKLLPRLVTPTAGLSKHGYVLNAPIDKEIESAKNGVESAKGWEICDRCKSRFQVLPERREEDGALASGGACTYHYGKPYFQDRNPLDPKAKREKKFRCCGQAMDDSIG
jgi:RNA exonuclease 1